MRLLALPDSLRRLWALDTFVYSLRVFIALGSVMIVCWALDRVALAQPIYLGTIACAIAETDDNWRGRLRALLVTLLCFTVAAFAVEALFPYPWLFGIGLAVSAFGLTMLGAVGERYRAIAYGTLILAIYTTIGMDQHARGADAFWREPLLLLGGAAWYGVLSVIWHALFTHQPVQQNLARLYDVLGDYLRLKASLFEPVRDNDIAAKQMALAQKNGQVVKALNTAKESILSRMGTRPSPKIKRYLKLYFIAQDVHERASSSHYPYNELADVFFHSDVMFRCQRLLLLQGRACGRLARTIQLRHPFERSPDSLQAMDDLRASLEFLRAQGRPQWHRLLRSLGALAGNLTRLDNRLASAGDAETDNAATDSSLFDRSPRSLRDAFGRIMLQLTPSSAVFRHALRLMVALTAGYAVLQVIPLRQGYWIVLTTLFVCQPNFGATLTRVGQRMVGTFIGLILGWALLRLFPDPLVQSVLVVSAGVVFFATRATRYVIATSAITLLVLLSFEQIGNGHDLIVPRMVDTVIGALIAGIAVIAILPDWQGRKLGTVAANAIASHRKYLQQIMAQYDTGVAEDLAYRIARRDAHNADAALSTVVSNILKEPGHVRRDLDPAMRFLAGSHTLLGYLSALGAHRDALSAHESQDELITRTAMHVAEVFDRVTRSLRYGEPLVAADPADQVLIDELERVPDDADDAHRLVLSQLALICRQLAPLRMAALRLMNESTDAPAAEVPAAGQSSG